MLIARPNTSTASTAAYNPGRPAFTDVGDDNDADYDDAPDDNDDDDDDDDDGCSNAAAGTRPTATFASTRTHTRTWRCWW